MTKKERTSCVFDHVLFFEFKELSKEEIQAAIIKVPFTTSVHKAAAGDATALNNGVHAVYRCLTGVCVRRQSRSEEHSYRRVQL